MQSIQRIQQERDEDVAASVHLAAKADLPAVVDLIRAARGDGGRAIGLDEVDELARNGRFLVLERSHGGLAATIYVRFLADRGYVAYLSVAPDLRGHHLATRMLGVADALCAAFDCTPVDGLPGGSAA